MTVYCGVDFHARQQTVCCRETNDAAIQLAELDHQADEVRGFYHRFPDEVIHPLCAYDDPNNKT